MSCFEGPAGFKRSMESRTLRQDRCCLPVSCVRGRQEGSPSGSHRQGPWGTCSTWSLSPRSGRWAHGPASEELHGLDPEGASCGCRGHRSGPARLADALGSAPTPTWLSLGSGSRGESPPFMPCRASFMASEPRAGPPLPLVRLGVPQGPTRDSSKCV